MCKSIIRTGGCADSHFLIRSWKARDIAPTVCCVARETKGSENNYRWDSLQKMGRLKAQSCCQGWLAWGWKQELLSWLQPQQASIIHPPGSPKMHEGDYVIIQLTYINLINQNSPPKLSPSLLLVPSAPMKYSIELCPALSNHPTVANNGGLQLSSTS